MTDSRDTCAMTAAPLPLMTRFWRWLGFREPMSPEMPEEMEGYAPGHCSSDVTIVLNFSARLRILISGRMMVRVCTKTDTFIERMWSRSTVGILPPGHELKGNRYRF